MVFKKKKNKKNIKINTSKELKIFIFNKFHSYFNHHLNIHCYLRVRIYNLFYI